MKIINLIENTQGNNKCQCEHGLAFYIETKKHKIVVDTGASENFILNANMHGIDLSQVDMLILSHGHYDHSGGIIPFSKVNNQAKIYIQKTACGEYYHVNEEVQKYIGIDKGIMELPQVVIAEGDIKIDDEIFLFSNVKERKMWPEGNKELKQFVDGCFVQDEFLHEQYVVISEGDRKVLISGCAHNGIINILSKYKDIYGLFPDVVISGFHMMKKSEYTQEETANIVDTAIELTKTKSRYYTGHCTGEAAFQIMKKIMGEKLQYVHSGDIVIE